MNYKIRELNIKSRQEGLKEFRKIGVTSEGAEIMVEKIFPLSLKVRGVNLIAANILKQEMLARGGDVAISRDALMGLREKENKDTKTDVIILGNIKSIKSLIDKIEGQQFGLKDLSVELRDYLDRMDKMLNGKELVIADKKFNMDKDVLIMGILNVTPDSFYDGGYYFEKDKAYRRVDAIVSEGADIIDVGGMSTRPGSLPVAPGEEIERVIPVIEYIKRNYNILISADTYRSEVAAKAIDAGAHIINDISGLSMDENIARVVAGYGVSVIIMHIKGTPENMQKDPHYENVIDEIYDYLEDRVSIAVSSGIEPEKIIIDPGIGFGKTLEHNLEVINKIGEFKMMGYPVMIGMSRKSFIGGVLDLPVEERLEGSLAAAVCSVMNGVNILRVHDVKETVRAVRVAKSIISGF
ncbi:MAG: dihydropteroate synthase [Actinomycetota bacterium]|nr:dihydropteroate synthase [Actinomycetota bacterium]